MIFNPGTSPAVLNGMAHDTLIEHLGIVFTEVGEEHISATMPVDKRHHQPFGILHGGASVTLAETLGSVAAYATVDPGYFCVGLEINANHIRAVRSGIVTGTARPVHRGKSTQVWEIRILDEQEQLVCVSRITMSVLQKK